MQAETAAIAWLDDQPPMSVWSTTVTVFEIRFGLATMPAGRRKSEREAAFGLALSDKLEGRILAFDERAAEEAALLMALRHRAGRPRELRDTMIAGIALSHGASLATGNVRHFDGLNVEIVDPWQRR
jgi:predicted nucleic acid-binding protein